MTASLITRLCILVFNLNYTWAALFQLSGELLPKFQLSLVSLTLIKRCCASTLYDNTKFNWSFSSANVYICVCVCFKFWQSYNYLGNGAASDVDRHSAKQTATKAKDQQNNLFDIIVFAFLVFVILTWKGWHCKKKKMRKIIIGNYVNSTIKYRFKLISK